MDALSEALQKVFNGQCCGWNNVLDILIVAVFIYYVLVLIRGTRAVQLLLGGEPDGEALPEDADAIAVEATAARYLAKGDPRGATAALEAARRYIADGRMDAASDLLLQLIAAGIADHDAQRLLVDVAKSLGKRDLAKAKVQLLVVALKLDGRTELAAEVEQLARAF